MSSKMALPDAIIPAVGLPARVLAGQTTRQALNPLLPSNAPFDGFNVALHVGDDATTVQQQRIELLKTLEPFGTQRLVWLEQIHSTKVHVVNSNAQFIPVHADALITREIGVACMMMTADCLPIILSNVDGTEVACIHAGWRGLLNGIIESTILAMQSPAVYCWLGAAIGSCHFEVGMEVYAAFVQQNPQTSTAFKAKPNNKFLADLYKLASIRLKQCQVQHISGGEACTYQQTSQFYSYRHSPHTGRMAAFVMIQPS